MAKREKNKGAVSEGAYPKQIEMRADYRSQVLGGKDQQRKGQRLPSDEAKYRTWRRVDFLTRD